MTTQLASVVEALRNAGQDDLAQAIESAASDNEPSPSDNAHELATEAGWSPGKGRVYVTDAVTKAIAKVRKSGTPALVEVSDTRAVTVFPVNDTVAVQNYFKRA